MDINFAINVEIEKASPDGRYVRGWAYVSHDEDGAVVDYSGQQIASIEVIREAAHEFMDVRVSKALHGKDGDWGPGIKGEIVESLIIDDRVAKALGMTSKRRGWFIGARIDDAEVQKGVRNGTFKQFSLGGRGRVEQLKEAA